jgi:transcriptional regulator with XRE-family HTH domain
MAVVTGLGRPFLSNIETGKKEPCLRSLEILAQSLEMTVSQLLRGV